MISVEQPDRYHYPARGDPTVPITRSLQITLTLAASVLVSGCGSAGPGDGVGVYPPEVTQSPQIPVPSPLPPQAGPAAERDHYESIGNAPFSVPADRGLLSNDSPNGGRVIPFEGATSLEGQVSVRSDGSFTYTPRFGVVGEDSFSYSIANRYGISKSEVTVQLTNRVYFVDNTAPNGGNGAFDSRFSTLPDAIVAAAEDDIVFVFSGSGEPYPLPPVFVITGGERFIGEAAGLTVDKNLPVIQKGRRPTLLGPIQLSSPVTLTGFRLDAATDFDAVSGVVRGNVILDDLEISNFRSRAVEISNIGRVAVQNCYLSIPNGRNGLMLTSNRDLNSWSISNVTFDCEGRLNDGLYLYATENAEVDVQIDGCSFIPGTGRESGSPFHVLCSRQARINLVAANCETYRASGPAYYTRTVESGRLTMTAVNCVSEGDLTAVEHRADGTSKVNCSWEDLKVNAARAVGVSVRMTNRSAGNIIIEDSTINGAAADTLGAKVTTTSDAASDVVVRRCQFDAAQTLQLESVSTRPLRALIEENVGGLLQLVGDRGPIEVEKLTGVHGGPLESINSFSSIQQSGAVSSLAAGSIGL